MFNNSTYPKPVTPDAYALPTSEHADYWRSFGLGLHAACILIDGLTETEIMKYVLHQEVNLSLMKSDNSRLQAEKDQFINLSNTDPLTGVLNRRGAEEAYARLRKANGIASRRATDKSPPVAARALIIDVDDFKEVNEVGGHPAGDHMLAAVAQIVVQQTRPNDIVARWGGDEFVVILPRVQEGRGLEAANAIRKQVQDLTGLTLSIGMGAFDYALTLQETVSLADAALYAAKQKGKNQVVAFDPTIN